MTDVVEQLTGLTADEISQATAAGVDPRSVTALLDWAAANGVDPVWRAAAARVAAGDPPVLPIVLTILGAAESARRLLATIDRMNPAVAVVALAQVVADLADALDGQAPRVLPPGGVSQLQWRIRWVNGNPVGARPTSWPTLSREVAEKMMRRETTPTVLESRLTVTWPTDGEPSGEWPRYVAPWTQVVDQ